MGIKDAIGFYGKESFFWEIIGTCDEDIDYHWSQKFETYLICQHKTYAPYGYNINVGHVPQKNFQNNDPLLMTLKEYRMMLDVREWLHAMDVKAGRTHPQKRYQKIVECYWRGAKMEQELIQMGIM